MGRYIQSYLVYGFKLETGFEEQDESFFEKFFEGYWWKEQVAEYLFKKQGKEVVSDEEEKNLIDNLKVEFDGFGYVDDELEWILLVKETRIVSYDGESAKISTDQLKVDPKWDKELKKFCELTGLKYREPNWLLTGSYS